MYRWILTVAPTVNTECGKNAVSLHSAVDDARRRPVASFLLPALTLLAEWHLHHVTTHKPHLNGPAQLAVTTKRRLIKLDAKDVLPNITAHRLPKGLKMLFLSLVTLNFHLQTRPSDLTCKQLPLVPKAYLPEQQQLSSYGPLNRNYPG